MKTWWGTKNVGILRRISVKLGIQKFSLNLAAIINFNNSKSCRQLSGIVGIRRELSGFINTSNFEVQTWWGTSLDEKWSSIILEALLVRAVSVFSAQKIALFWPFLGYFYSRKKCRKRPRKKNIFCEVPEIFWIKYTL